MTKLILSNKIQINDYIQLSCQFCASGLLSIGNVTSRCICFYSFLSFCDIYVIKDDQNKIQ